MFGDAGGEIEEQQSPREPATASRFLSEYESGMIFAMLTGGLPNRITAVTFSRVTFVPTRSGSFKEPALIQYLAVTARVMTESEAFAWRSSASTGSPTSRPSTEAKRCGRRAPSSSTSAPCLAPIAASSTWYPACLGSARRRSRRARRTEEHDAGRRPSSRRRRSGRVDQRVQRPGCRPSQARTLRSSSTVW